MQIRNFQEAHEALRVFYGVQHPKMNTLPRMKELLAFLGNPQDSLRVIHIAGTSGKTSSAYYAAALLQAAGFKVGLTVSPHVDEANERVQINLVPLPPKDFFAAVSELLDLVHESGITPSYFEFMTALAFYAFKRQAVDYAVVEVGLGGRLDATNTINRDDKVCVITDIGLDHTEILGDTLAQIAGEKAGIIQPHTHTFMYRQGDDVMKVVEGKCKEQSSSLHLVPQVVSVEAAALPLFQQRNFGLASAVVNYVLERDKVKALAADERRNAAGTYIPARMEVVRVGKQTLIIDGAHNGQKIGELMKSVRAKFGDTAITALVAFTSASEQHWQGGVDALLPNVSQLIITAFKAEQDVPKVSVEPSLVAAYCQSHGFTNFTIEPDPAKGYLELLKEGSGSIKLVVGSFYLLNHVRPLALK